MIRQVKIRTRAAITHTAFAGSSAAVIRPAPNAIGAKQDLHLLIIITLYILRARYAGVTDILKKISDTGIMDPVML